ncbi:MAG TPA: hypothetical protein VES20_07835, partial [Bryobacteraceae bacterium]|nr:hypothetical protein [Bryobacteraceae bacterium]
VSADASRVALSATHVYVFPFSTGWDSVKILSLATGVETAWNINLNGSAGGRVTPDGRYLYIGGVLRYDVLNKTPETNPGYFSVSCSDLWFTQDASRIFTSCGEFRRSTEGSNTEPVYGGRLFERGTAWATHSAARKLVAAVPVPAQPGYNQAPEPAKISLFSDDYLTAVGSLDVPKMPAGAQQVAAHARWLFWSNSADRLYAIVQADEASGLLFDYALYTVSFDTSCGVTLGAASASVGLGGGTGTLAVSATAGCVWHPTSSAPWLIVARNGVATGSTAVS